MTTHNHMQPIDLRNADSIVELSERVQVSLSDHYSDAGYLRLQTSCLNTVVDFEELLTQLGCTLMQYEFASTPRSKLAGEVYSSTEYPADQEILLHNEMSYTTFWPSRLWFFCETAAAEGGETPTADSRRIYQKMDSSIRDLFEEKQLLYVRNYRPGLDLPWQTVFATDNKEEVATRCQSMGLNFEWKGNELKTWQRCQSVAQHPVSGEMAWFNQAHLFHISNLNEEYRSILLSMYQEDELPRNVLFGDGSKIDENMLLEIKEVMSAEKQKFRWTAGEIIVVDNVKFAHGREPYKGERKIAVAME